MARNPTKTWGSKNNQRIYFLLSAVNDCNMKCLHRDTLESPVCAPGVRGRSCSASSLGILGAQLSALSWSFSTVALQPASTGTANQTTLMSIKFIVILAKLNLITMCHLSQNISTVFQKLKVCRVPVSHPFWLPSPLLFLQPLCVQKCVSISKHMP